MRIIKPGNIPHPERHFICGWCQCEFIADLKDMQCSQRKVNYVICPTCQAFINWSTGTETMKD